MATVPSRTPSPTPQAPQQTATDPGPRAVALHKIYSSALSSTLKSNSYPAFASCFPTPAKYCPTALEGVWKQLNSRLQEECQKDFEKILEERDVVNRLQAWDQLIEEARVRRDRGVESEDSSQPLHLLGAAELKAAFTADYMRKVTDELSTKLSETQKQNRDMATEMRRQREEIESLVSGLEAMAQDIDGAVKALEREDRDQMKKEVWTMEGEVSPTT